MGLFNAPREYTAYYEKYYDQFDFYDSRDAWLESIRDIPVKAVHLFALHWLHLEVYNGGFEQYFFNSTATSAPEAVDGFDAIGMPDVASIIRKAMKKLASPFPSEREVRRDILETSSEPMHFDEENAAFYELADTSQFFNKKPKFVPFANAYARAG